MRNWSSEEVQRYLGEERGCWLTHSSRPEVRDGAASGGTTSQLLINLLEQGLVDGVLVWRLRCGAPDPVAEPFIAKTAQEVLAARGSKYTTVRYPRHALPLIEAFEGRLAVVAVPCDASYLRRKMRVDPELERKIACIVTLFCGHNSEPELTKLVVRKHGMEWDDVTSFRYRTGLWRGRLTFTAADGRSVDVSTRRFTHYQNLHFFSERKCLNCTDHFGYDGDICTGDIWARDQRNEDIKPTLVVAKTERGRALFDRARKDIELEAVDPRVVINGNSRGMTYHYQISARAEVARWFGITIKDPLKLPVTPLDRVVAAIGVFNYWWSHHPKWGHLVQRLPWWAIQGYIYLFKGLQQLNLFLYRPFPPTDKISLIGATLAGNRGAEAMLVTSIGRLREHFPHARFVIHSYFPREDRQTCKDLGVEVVDASPAALVLQYFPAAVADAVLRKVGLNFPRGWMPRGPRELKESRVLLDLFGVSYNDGREKFLPFNVLSNWPAMLMGTPVVKLSQAVGTYRNRLTRIVGKWMLRKCERVFARGRRTEAMTREIGIVDNLGYAPDIAFLYRETDALGDAPREYTDALVERIETHRRAGSPVLVLSVSAVVRKKCASAGLDHDASMAAIADHFLDKGYVVVLLPNANREGVSTTHNNDLPVIVGIASHCRSELRGERLLAIDRGLDTAMLRRVIGASDYLIASRFHAMIAGLSLGVPTMVMGWSHKYREILEMFEIADWAYDYKDLDVATTIERAEAFVAQAPEIARRIATHLPRVEAEARVQFDWLASFLRVQANVCTPDEDDEA